MSHITSYLAKSSTSIVREAENGSVINLILLLEALGKTNYLYIIYDLIRFNMIYYSCFLLSLFLNYFIIPNLDIPFTNTKLCIYNFTIHAYSIIYDKFS